MGRGDKVEGSWEASEEATVVIEARPGEDRRC